MKSIKLSLLIAFVSTTVAFGQYSRLAPTQKQMGQNRQFVHSEAAPQAEPMAMETAPASAAPASSAYYSDQLIEAYKQFSTDMVAVGQEVTYTITVRAKKDTACVGVAEKIGEGLEYVSSSPEAAMGTQEWCDGQLSWDLGDMDAGTEKTIQVVVRPMSEGSFETCSVFKAYPRICAPIRAGTPRLAITKTGPAEMLVGETASYNIQVTNTGTMTALAVVITDELPEPYQHGSGQSVLTFPIGDLQPGMSHNLTVPIVGTASGNYCNVASAAADNVEAVSAEACTTWYQPGVEIAKTGPEIQKIGKNASYKVVVTNSGEVLLNNLIVRDIAPAETTIVSADGGAVNGKTITWNVPALRPNEEVAFDVVLTTKRPGTYCNVASVEAPMGLRDSAEACTKWIGVPAILVELIDLEDPLLVGEETTYRVRVTNQGTAIDQNVSVVVSFPRGIDPVSASGSTAGNINGKNVSFTPIPTLEPKTAIEYNIRARAVAEGDNRVEVKVTSDLVPAPVFEIESTHVY